MGATIEITEGLNEDIISRIVVFKPDRLTSIFWVIGLCWTWLGFSQMVQVKSYLERNENRNYNSYEFYVDTFSKMYIFFTNYILWTIIMI